MSGWSGTEDQEIEDLFYISCVIFTILRPEFHFWSTSLSSSLFLSVVLPGTLRVVIVKLHV